MARLIVKCNYFKNEPASHKSNFMKYLGTREGVEFDPAQMPRMFWQDADMHGKKANYVDYLAERPGSVRVEGQMHGLFSEEGMMVDLDQAMEEVAGHQGTVWINVVSLRREDAERLGYDGLEKWQALLRSHVSDLAEAFQIKPENLKWYAAFHDEGHHPHVHLVVFSKNGDGYLSRHGIEKLKSAYVREIFKDELSFLYEEKTKHRKTVKEAAGENLIRATEAMGNEAKASHEIFQKMAALSKRLSGIQGKKVYGYLHKDVKAMVDDVFRELEKLPEVKACYDGWLEWQARIVGYYQDGEMRIIPMSQNPEFKSVRNLIIQEALRMEHGVENVRRSKKDYEEDTEEVEKNKAPMIKEPKKDEGLTANDLSRLLKGLQKTFRGKMEQSRTGRRMISEFKARQLEIEKKAGLGQRDAEVAEDITQTL
jgi:hypothetical protein